MPDAKNWIDHFSDRVFFYFEDNGELVADLFFAVEKLTEPPVPPPDAKALPDGKLYVYRCGHIVLFRLEYQERIIRILDVFPVR